MVSPIADSNGTFAGFRGVAVDVTATRRHAEALTEAKLAAEKKAEEERIRAEENAKKLAEELKKQEEKLL